MRAILAKTMLQMKMRREQKSVPSDLCNSCRLPKAALALGKFGFLILTITTLW
jgi:hypothetical protein